MGESSPAYRAFACFRDLGPDRTIVAAAREFDRHESLLRRWAAKHEWWPRVQEWDLANEREERALVRRERAEARRQRMRTARQLQQLGMAGLSRLVHRDPATGETVVAGAVKPRDAVALVRLGADLEDRLAPPPEEQTNAADTTAALLHRRPDADLQRLLALIEQPPHIEEEDGHVPD